EFMRLERLSQIEEDNTGDLTQQECPTPSTIVSTTADLSGSNGSGQSNGHAKSNGHTKATPTGGPGQKVDSAAQVDKTS
ncbi:MAG: hypothetical protein IH986_13475, partial [Planctomycetes bacterium]|nr:hypothetical protein [Planctomycetota bacterium]